jgi:hypothetical protein
MTVAGTALAAPSRAATIKMMVAHAAATLPPAFLFAKGRRMRA